MSTLAINRTDAGIALGDLIAAAGVALAGFVYELFSHGVYSLLMIYAFAFPLLLGALPFAVRALHGKKQLSAWCVRLLHWGIATMTVGCLFQGALEIYGTTSCFVQWYWVAGPLLVLGAIAAQCLRKKFEE